MKTFKTIIAAFVCSMTFAACEDFLNITPEGQTKRDELLATPEGIEDALYGVYSQLRSNTLYGQELYFQTLEVMAHNLYCDGNESVTALGNFEYDNTNVKSLFEGIWIAMYKNISNLNSVLDAPLVANAKEFPYTIYKGEALGLRAFMHFDLVRLFAEQYTENPKADGIPYATEFSLHTPDFESLKENYAHILADLHEADSLLANEEKYEGEGYYMLDRQIHFNKYAVKATLARVYLTMGDKVNAAKYAQEVIDGGKYYLKEKTEVKNDLAGVLSKKECIFGVYYSGFFTQVYAKLEQTTTRYSLDLRHDYKDIYNKDNSGNDYRTDAYFKSVALGSESIDRLSKFTEIYELQNIVSSRPTELILGINMIRTPEMYYIMAEALLDNEALAGEYDKSALAYYNDVRMYRGLEPLQTLTLQHINEERYKEYIGEGQLFFNMKRLNQDIVSYDGAITYKASKNIYVVPIPDIEKENRY